MTSTLQDPPGDGLVAAVLPQLVDTLQHTSARFLEEGEKFTSAIEALSARDSFRTGV